MKVVLEQESFGVDQVRIGAFTIPTDAPESDGTFVWESTTLVVIELRFGKAFGLGYTYVDAAAARLVSDHLAEIVQGCDPANISALSKKMFAQLRNNGGQGLVAAAISAVDIALWDLKARLLGVSLTALLGAEREAVDIYGSGGFTSYSDAQLRRQFDDWQAQGIRSFKMKVGRLPEADLARVRAARLAIGAEAELFVDANSAYTRKQALAFARLFADECDVRWLEEPLSPNDLRGLSELRQSVPSTVEIAEGEYGYDLDYFHRLLAADAVDVAMADLTRCGGVTGFRKIATLCEAWNTPLSSHCAPALHAQVGCTVGGFRHAEYFHDHARIETLLFEGVGSPKNGKLRPDLTQPGLGLKFKWSDAERYAV